jgi:hypothetical protein
MITGSSKSEYRFRNWKTNGILVLLFLFLVCTFGKAGAQQQQGDSLKRTMHRIQAGVADSNGWYLAESTGGHFKVKLPAPFNDFEVSGVDENGRRQEIHTVGVLTKDKAKFSATETLKDPPIEKGFLDKFPTSFKNDGTLRSSRRFQFLGYPALEIATSDGARTSVMRTIVVKNRVYMLIAEFDAGRERDLADFIGRFMKSLELSPGESGSK